VKIELTKRMRDEGWTTINSHIRKPLSHAVEGAFRLQLEIDPPTATHHDKEIGRRFKKGGASVPTLRNSAALNAAWATYLTAIPERRFLVPLAPPVKLWVVFQFRWTNSAPGHTQPPMREHIAKPDLDNSVKVLKDVLALRGYLVADEHVSREDLTKQWAGRGSVYVLARSLNPNGDDGALEPIDAPAGFVVPTLWKTVLDKEITKKAARGPARLARKAANAAGCDGERR
jgi:Holliday junction resolvase RusA-like endonuclease